MRRPNGLYVNWLCKREKATTTASVWFAFHPLFSPAIRVSLFTGYLRFVCRSYDSEVHCCVTWQNATGGGGNGVEPRDGKPSHVENFKRWHRSRLMEVPDMLCIKSGRILPKTTLCKSELWDKPSFYTPASHSRTTVFLSFRDQQWTVWAFLLIENIPLTELKKYI